jgi:hypothetical protein
MFAKQSGLFDLLKYEGTCFTPKAIKILKSIFCNPKANLEHDGVITLNAAISSPDIRAARWAKSIYNWDYASEPPSKGGGMSYIYAQECTGPNGSGAGGDLLKIYLPVGGSQDPNVEANETIMFFRADDNTLLAPGYGDNRIGSIIMGSQGDKGVKGYAMCDGSENAAGANKGNGTGINLSTKFPRCWSSAADSGSTGGSAASSLTIEGSVSIGGTVSIGGSLSIAGTVSGSDIGNHSHTLNETTIGTGSESTQTVIDGTPTGDSGIDFSEVAVAFTGAGGSGSPSVSFTGAGGSGSPSVSFTGAGGSGSPSVSFTGSGGSGSPSAASIPPFTYVSFLERVDNSRSGLGD